MTILRETFQKFEVSTSQILMFVSDGAAAMLSVGRCLKESCGSFLHATCIVHGLHPVAQSIRECFPEVDGLIKNCKKVFLKSPKRIRAFHRQYPGIPEPQQPILTRWGTWLKAAFYYFQYFPHIKSV